MTDQEIIDKFKSMASKYMDEQQMAELISTIFELDKLDDISKLSRLMVFSKIYSEGFRRAPRQV